MNTTRRALTALAGGALVLLFTVGGAQAAQADTSRAAEHSCPSGHVCMYAGKYNMDTGIIEHSYYTYGSHQFYDEYGYHYIYNNQTDGAGFTLCRGSYGTDCDDTYRAVGAYLVHLTEYNSIKLVP